MSETYRIRVELLLDAETEEEALTEFKLRADAGQLPNEEWRLVSPDGDLLLLSERRGGSETDSDTVEDSCH